MAGKPKQQLREASPTDPGIPLWHWNYLIGQVSATDTIPEGPPTPDRTWIRLVEMDEAVGPEESSEFRDRTATVLYWDFDQFKWRRTDPAHVITIVTDPWRHLVIHAGERLLVWFHRQSGKHIPMNPPTFRHAVTSADKSNQYPDPGDFPNVYPIGHVKSSFPIPSGSNFTTTPVHTLLSSLTKNPPQPPHGGTFVGDVTGWVFNLAGGGGDGENYIPEGTPIPTWFHNGQWWTYWVGSFEESSSASLEGLSSSSSSSSSSISSSSVSTESSTSSVSTGESSLSVTSSSSIICQPVVQHAGINWPALPGYDATKKQALIHVRGCWEWQTIEPC